MRPTLLLASSPPRSAPALPVYQEPHDLAPKGPPPLGAADRPLFRYLQLVVPEQLGLPVGERNRDNRVVAGRVALLYRADRASPTRLPVVRSDLHARAGARVR